MFADVDCGCACMWKEKEVRDVSKERSEKVKVVSRSDVRRANEEASIMGRGVLVTCERARQVPRVYEHIVSDNEEYSSAGSSSDWLVTVYVAKQRIGRQCILTMGA